MSSGVKVSDECKKLYDEIKKDKKYRYAIFAVHDEKEIGIEKKGDRNATYDDFLADLHKVENECRYGLFDLEYTHQCQGTTEATKKQKLFLMNWCPENAKIRSRMVYASSFEALKKVLIGVSRYIQSTDLTECSYEFVEQKLRENDRN